MGKMRMGILDGFIGKVGTVVGSFWKGKKVLRGYNEFGANPRTKKQKAVRARFAQLVEMAATFLPALRLGMGEYAKRRQSTEIGNFVKENWGAVTITSGGELSVNYGDIVVGQGRLAEVSFGNPDFDTAGQVTATFSSIDKDANEDDLVYLFVYQPDTGKGVLSDGVKRSTESATVEVPSVWSGLRVHVYGFAMGYEESDEKGVSSKSAYVGSGDIN